MAVVVLPPLHAVHLDAPAALYEPIAHAVHELTGFCKSEVEATEYFPAGQDARDPDKIIHSGSTVSLAPALTLVTISTGAITVVHVLLFVETDTVTARYVRPSAYNASFIEPISFIAPISQVNVDPPSAYGIRFQFPSVAFPKLVPVPVLTPAK